ncbi:hypothetical protein ACIBHX_46620 [Nonomuraea sp. NPDC050536]|uniref:hypothetical protein n=1 Tax=Nonomuraea sp. NPDC050536 TaxID=3364366 RepID=UPI0037C75283
MDLARMVHEFETSYPTESFEAQLAYLDLLEALFQRASLTIQIDAELAATWLWKRKPRKGKRVPRQDRRRLCRRTRAHGRHSGNAWAEAIRFVRRQRDVIEEFIKIEKAAAKRAQKEGQ